MTEIITQYGLVVLMGVVLLFGVGIAFIQQNKRNEIFANQADKRGGEFVKGTLFRRSELRLPYKGNVLVVYSLPGGKNRAPRTIATLHLEQPALPTMDVLRNDLAQKIMGALGRERVLLNDEEFDRQCVVRSEDPYLPQRILSADLRGRFLDRSLHLLELRVSAQNVQVKILTIPSDEASFAYFIDTALAILQKLL